MNYFVDARCSVPFTPVGCFNDFHQKNARPLPELLMTDRDMNSVKYSGIKVNWGEWDMYMDDIVCRCAEKAKEKKYSHFGIQNYGKCTLYLRGRIITLLISILITPEYNITNTWTNFIQGKPTYKRLFTLTYRNQNSYIPYPLRVEGKNIQTNFFEVIHNTDT